MQPVVSVRSNEEPAVSDKIRTLQALSSRKAELIAKLSVIEQRKLKLRQAQEEIEREEGQVHEEMRTITSQEMRSLAPDHADTFQESSRYEMFV